MKVEIMRGNIVEADTEVIVNAANTDLILGGGVAGAIRRAGGPAIQEECNKLAPIPVGDVAVTGAGNLPHKYVFHAATMKLQNPTTTPSVVERCVKNALDKAESLRCKSIAFPALGTGVAGLSLDECAKATFRAILDFEKERGTPLLERVVIVLFDEGAQKLFTQIWSAMTTNCGES